MCVGSSSGNGTSSLPEGFSLSAPACTQQHHLPGKLRRTGFQLELLHTSQKLGWAVGKVPQSQESRDTHLLLLQPQFCPRLARLRRDGWRNSARTNPAQQHQGCFTSTQELTKPSHQSSQKKAVGTRAAALGAGQMRLCLLSRDWVG